MSTAYKQPGPACSVTFHDNRPFDPSAIEENRAAAERLEAKRLAESAARPVGRPMPKRELIDTAEAAAILGVTDEWAAAFVLSRRGAYYERCGFGRWDRVDVGRVRVELEEEAAARPEPIDGSDLIAPDGLRGAFCGADVVAILRAFGAPVVPMPGLGRPGFFTYDAQRLVGYSQGPVARYAPILEEARKAARAAESAS